MNWSEGIQAFKSYLLLERGLSENTVINYVYDVQKLVSYFESNNITIGPTKVSSSDLLQFIYEAAKEVKPSSQSRLLSGLRTFFDFLMIEGLRSGNPVTLVEPPKIGSALPVTLSTLEVEKLLSSFTFTSCSTVLHEHFHTKKYLPIQQGVRVCLHRSQARAKSHGSKPKHPPVQQKFKKIF